MDHNQGVALGYPSSVISIPRR